METDTGPAVTAPGRGLDSLAFACTAIVVADLDRSVGWYESILGFICTARMRIDGATVALLEGAGTQLELIQGDAPSVSTEPSLFADPPDHLLPIGNKFLVFAVENSNARPISSNRGVYRSSGAAKPLPPVYFQRRSVTSKATSFTSLRIDDVVDRANAATC
jgi:catechol 2,3-dioxygenase-like lactoylglutathione lyase family enzyme